MSLSVINRDRDGFRTHTKKFYSGRTWNDSLNTQDIAGKKFNKQELSLDSLDLDSFKTDLNMQIKTGTSTDQHQEHYISVFTNQSTIWLTLTLKVHNLIVFISQVNDITMILWIQLINCRKLKWDQSLLQNSLEMQSLMTILKVQSQRNKLIIKQDRSWKFQTLMAQNPKIWLTIEKLSIPTWIIVMWLMLILNQRDQQILWTLNTLWEMITINKSKLEKSNEISQSKALSDIMDLSLKIWWLQTSMEQHQAQKVLDHSLIKLERTFDRQTILATSWEQLQALWKRLLFLNDKQTPLIQTIRFQEQLSMLEQLDML